MATGENTLKGKLSYKGPRLTVYGSVRDLTGAVSGTMPGDGGNMMP
jgi:hypothetical protein